MKYIVTYNSPRKNAKRHVEMLFGRRKTYESIEEAKSKSSMWGNPWYDSQIMTANYKDVVAEITAKEKKGEF